MDIQTEDVEDGTCRVTYCPTEPGNYIVSIRFAEEHVPGLTFLTAFHNLLLLSRVFWFWGRRWRMFSSIGDNQHLFFCLAFNRKSVHSAGNW